MAANGATSEVVAGRLVRAPARKSDSLWLEAGRRFRRHRLAMVGLLVLGIMVGSVLIGPLVYRVPIDEIDFRAKLKAPSWAHPFGTDDLGRDLLARVLWGGRVSLGVGLVGTHHYMYAVDLEAKVARTHAERRKIETGIARARVEERRLPEFRSRVAELNARLTALRNVLPEQKDVAICCAASRRSRRSRAWASRCSARRVAGWCCGLPSLTPRAPWSAPSASPSCRRVWPGPPGKRTSRRVRRLVAACLL